MYELGDLFIVQSRMEPEPDSVTDSRSRENYQWMVQFRRLTKLTTSCAMGDRSPAARLSPRLLQAKRARLLSPSPQMTFDPSSPDSIWTQPRTQWRTEVTNSVPASYNRLETFPEMIRKDPCPQESHQPTCAWPCFNFPSSQPSSLIEVLCRAPHHQACRTCTYLRLRHGRKLFYSVLLLKHVFEPHRVGPLVKICIL
jgi:hypothetical protein